MIRVAVRERKQQSWTGEQILLEDIIVQIRKRNGVRSLGGHVVNNTDNWGTTRVTE